MKKRKLGFTLVELMISMSIITILSLVLTASFSRAQKDGRDRRRVDDLKAIQNAAEQMVLLSGTYPVNSNSYRSDVSWSAGGQMVLQSFPEDPKNKDLYVYSPSNITSLSYCVCALMENSKSGVSGASCDFSNPAGGYYCVKSQQ